MILTGCVQPDIVDMLLCRRCDGGPGGWGSSAQGCGVTEEAVGGVHRTDDGTCFRHR